MRGEILIIELDILEWDDKLWEKFISQLCKRYRKFDVLNDYQIAVRYSERQFSEFEIKVMVFGFLSEFMDKQKGLCIELSGEIGQRILPIDFEPEAVTYLFYSTRLCILQTIPERREWLKQYFTNVCVFYNPACTNFFYFDEELKSALDMQNVWYREIPYASMIDFTKKSLNEGLYINIHLDEYYIVAKDNFGKRHYVHENLVYGYDADRKIILAYGFTKRQKMKRFEMTYEEYLYAFEKGRLFFFCGANYLSQKEYAPVTLCKAKECTLKEKEKFTFQKFQNKLKEFLYPKESEMVEDDLHIYGVNIYKYICDQLKEDSQEIVDFRTFQFLYEHKNCIERRMIDLCETYHLEGELHLIIEEYQQVINCFQQIRFLYLKQLYVTGYTGIVEYFVTERRVLDRIIHELKKGSEKEAKLLNQLIQVKVN